MNPAPPNTSIRRRLVAGSVVLIVAAFLVCAASIYLLIYRPILSDLTSLAMVRASEKVAVDVQTLFANLGAIAMRESDRGRAGLIDLDRPRALNQLITPLFKDGTPITSSAVAEDTGREVLIFSSPDGGWRNRLTNPDAWGNQASFLTWDAQGNLLASERRIVDYDARRRPWFTAVMAQPATAGVYWTAPYRFVSTQELGISAVVRWQAPDTHRYAMTLDVRLMDLTGLTQKINVARSGLAAILTETGQVLALPRDPRFATGDAIKAELFKPVAGLAVAPLTAAFSAWETAGRPEVRLLRYDVDGVSWLTTFYPIHLAEQTFWVAALAPSADFVALPSDTLALGALIVLGTIVIASIAAIWLGGRLSGPIERLTVESARLGRMDLRDPIDVRSPVHEIDVLARALETMRLGLVQAQAELEAKTEHERQIERAVQESRLQLLRAQKMEAVGQLTGGVAHDFNNLLAVIRGNLELIEEELGTQPHLQRMLQACIRAAERGAALTRSLLAFSRQQPLEPRVVDVNALIDELAELLRRTLPVTIRLAIKAEATWTCEADPGQLQQAILNLATNAKDAMPDGGRLTIETGDVRLDGAEPQADVAPGEYVMVAIHDTGHGMLPDVVARACDPFFTTKEPGKGSGLGLSMVYGFAKQSGGHLRIASEPGRGTSMFLYLRRSTAARDRPPVRGERPAVRGRGETILVVEDDAEMQTLVSTLVQSLGYAAVVAGDAATALDLLQDGLRPAVLLTDIVLPGRMNGPHLAREALRLLPGLKVLYMSAYADTGALQHGPPEGAAYLLQKPFRKDDLAAKLRAILEETVP